MKTRILFTTFLLCVIASASMADEQKALLDSTIWNEKGSSLGKSEYTYNTSEQMVLSYDYHWEKSSKSWNVTMKYEYFYNEKGDRIERTDYMWNADGGKWMGYQQIKTSYTYDVDNRIISYIDSTHMSFFGNYVDIHKYVYSYDESGVQTGCEIFVWDVQSEAWLLEKKQTYTYDAAGNRILAMEVLNINSTWSNSAKTVMEYDANGYLLTDTTYTWSIQNEDWSLERQTSYYYHNYNTALNQLEVSHEPKSTKLLRDGQMYILRDGKTYTITGQEVK